MIKPQFTSHTDYPPADSAMKSPYLTTAQSFNKAHMTV